MDKKPAVLVTGASSGIGRALAREYARRGHAVALTGRRAAVLEEVRAEIAADPAAAKAGPGGAPVRVEIAALDVRDSAAVHAVVADLAGRLGDVGIVFANAGIGGERFCGDGHFAKDEDTIRTNVIGAMATIDAAVELFRQSRGGQIVGISSVAAFRGMPGSAAYCASKAALTTYLEAVRAEVESAGIAITTISPGYIDTPINQRMKSRPFLITPEEGARQIADLVDRKVRHSTVPVLPWGAVGTLMRLLPDALWYRAIGSSAAQRVAGRD